MRVPKQRGEQYVSLKWEINADGKKWGHTLVIKSEDVKDAKAARKILESLIQEGTLFSGSLADEFDEPWGVFNNNITGPNA